MIVHRPAAERGHTQLDWLDSRHTFSFNVYHDPAWVRFGPLRVINDDRIAPGGGFPTHGHRDMEIITWVLEGRLAHEDSLGNRGVLEPGMAQVMTAGRGIRHSEFNPSDGEPGHFLQIWIMPRERGLEPKYADRHFDPAATPGRLIAVASGDDREESLRIEQDAVVAACVLEPAQSVRHDLGEGRIGWVQVARGAVRLNGELELTAGDGAGLREESVIALEDHTADTAEVLLFDMAE